MGSWICLGGLKNDTTAPTTPVISATVASSTEIDISLTTPSTDAGGLRQYVLERSPNGSTSWTTLATGLSIFPYADTGLSSSTTYYYRCTASDFAANASVSSTVNAATSSGSLTLFRTATFEFGTNGGTVVNTTDGIDTTDGSSSVVDTARFYSGSKSMRCDIVTAANQMGGIHQLKSVNNGGSLTVGDQIWTRGRVYIPTSWSMTTGDGGMKFFRYRTYITGGVPSGSNTIQLWGAGPSPSGLRTEQEGATPDTRLFTPTGGWNDRWVTFEFYIKLGTGTNGILRSWVDGVLRGEVLNCDTLGSTSFLSLDCHWLDYFNNGAPKNQSLWIDEISIAWSGLSVPPSTDAAGNHFIGYP